MTAGGALNCPLRRAESVTLYLRYLRQSDLMEVEQRMTPRPDILVVDDNTDAAMSLARLLRLFGNEVRTADSGAEALAQMDVRRPDAVLLDLGMPGMDGLETARHIRRCEAWRGVPLIAVTGWGQDHDRRQTEEAGFFAHLVKPVNIQELEDVLQRALVSRS